jgi:hypothetical protein
MSLSGQWALHICETKQAEQYSTIFFELGIIHGRGFNTGQLIDRCIFFGMNVSA